jgi:hypothetical protein
MLTPLLTYEKAKTKVIQHEDIRITAADIEEAIKDMKFPEDSPQLKFFDYPSMLNPNLKPLPPDEHKKLLKLIEKMGSQL